MSHVKRAQSDAVERFIGRTTSGEQRFIDITAISGIIKMMQELFASFCGGSGSVPPRPAEEVAERMKYPSQEDDEYHYKLAQTSAKSVITKNNNPDGKRIKGRRLRELRAKYAVKAFYAEKDSAAAQSIEDLTAFVEEQREAL